MHITRVVLTAAAVGAAACPAALAGVAGSGTLPPPPPLPSAGGFVRTVDNPWFPLKPGTVLTYEGEDEGTPARTFRAGRDGARAGIFMPAHPHPGQQGWQEYAVGHAQDRYRVIDRHSRVRTPAVASTHAMLIQETTPLEPGVVDHKIYVRGIGAVREETVKGGDERYQLVSRRVRTTR